MTAACMNDGTCYMFGERWPMWAKYGRRSMSYGGRLTNGGECAQNYGTMLEKSHITLVNSG